MPRVVVDVMLKPELLDPQGKAVQAALTRIGLPGVASVRQGKRFEIELVGPVDPAAVEDVAERLLANTVIEEYAIHLEDR